MNTEKKTIPTTSVDLEKMIDGNLECFEVQFNALGEVLKVENDVLDLPDAAKLMTYGRVLNNELRQIVVSVRELKHIIPMMATGLVTTEDTPKWLLPIYEALEKLRLENEEKLDQSIIQDTWTKAFYSSNQKEKYRYFFKKFLLDGFYFSTTVRGE